MKKVVVVVAIAAIVAVAVYLDRSTETTSIPVSELEQPQEPAGEAGTPPMANTHAARDRGTSPDANIRMEDVRTPRATNGETSETFPPVATPSADEAKQAAECSVLSKRRREREQAAHDSEQKDPAWAYEMEQKLREYALRRFRTTAIEVIAIDCKTTFCDITAQGFVPESNEFSDGLRAVGKERWNDFTGTSTSHTVAAGKVLYRGEVSRTESYRKHDYYTAEEKEQVAACDRLASQQSQRERAARDAEPRDAGWADPTEQLLRQYLLAQVVKHPVEQLEITCRTTFCQVKASGQGMESYLAFQKAAQEVASEPWSDLRNGRGGGSSYGDEWQQDYTLHRRGASN